CGQRSGSANSARGCAGRRGTARERGGDVSGVRLPEDVGSAHFTRGGWPGWCVRCARKSRFHEVTSFACGEIKALGEFLWAGARWAARLWRMRNRILAVSLALVCPVVLAQVPSVADRVAQQNSLFEEYYQAGLKNSPERATSLGDYRYNNLLSQHSLKAIADEHAQADEFLARLEKISTEGMSDQDLLSHELMERQLKQADVNYSLKNYEMAINQQNGVHTSLADMPLSVPLDSVQ